MLLWSWPLPDGQGTWWHLIRQPVMLPPELHPGQVDETVFSRQLDVRVRLSNPRCHLNAHHPAVGLRRPIPQHLAMVVGNET